MGQAGQTTEEGGFLGDILQGVGNGLGELWGGMTGQNQARKDRMTAEDNIEIQKENDRLEKIREQQKKQGMDIAASNSAAALRVGESPANNKSKLGLSEDPEKDILGL